MSDETARIRTTAEQLRVSERLLLRFNTIAVVSAATLNQLADGVQIDASEVRAYARQLAGVARDARAVASEEAP